MENVTNTNVTENNLNNNKPGRTWRIFKRTILIIVIFYALIVTMRVFAMFGEDKVKANVAEIHSLRLTMSDVDGTKLPPMPDEVLNNSTVEGIDVNHNYVRDDVERWIFETYPIIEERAAWMQWARATSLVMFKSENKQTLKAIMEEEDRAMQCTTNIYVKPEKNTPLDKYNKLEDQLKDKIFNTEMRKKAETSGYKNMTSFGSMHEEECDVFKSTK